MVIVPVVTILNVIIQVLVVIGKFLSGVAVLTLTHTRSREVRPLIAVEELCYLALQLRMT